MITHVLFVRATRRFVKDNTDKIQALFGVLDSDRFGIDRKIAAIAAILGITSGDVPAFGYPPFGTRTDEKATKREIGRYLAVMLRRDWRRETEEALLVHECRRQLREREELDWLRLPLAERIRLKRAGRAANGTICTVPSAPKPARMVWDSLRQAQLDLLAFR